ncbi:hypothetical protein KIPB_011849, partial [Kipferlia bialata]|eukprot:g11849.t1
MEGRVMEPRELDPRNVFVTNLPYHTTSEDLKEFMAQAGEVEVCRVILTAGREELLSSGRAAVTYVTNEGGEKAISTLNEAEFQNRNLRVFLDRTPNRDLNYVPGKVCALRNLPWSIKHWHVSTLMS